MPSIDLRSERVRDSSRFKDFILRKTAVSLQDFPSTASSGSFSREDVCRILAESCLEGASFLFSAGAEAGFWRQWCGLAGQLFALEGDDAYAMQLMVIARIDPADERLSELAGAGLSGYRNQAVHYVIFGSPKMEPPASSTRLDSPDKHYEAICDSLKEGEWTRLADSIEQVVRFWLSETSYGQFEPGFFPVFEPEINSVVAALIMRGVPIVFRDPSVQEFLLAGLEP